MHYTPPTPAELEQLKADLDKSSGEMAELFGLANGRQWRRYLSEDPANRRDMGMHMLFFAMARLELDETTIERVLNRMRKVGAAIDLGSPSQP
ncbi:MAG: XRE family transcriptional regulator [Pseudomonadota bacterium]